MAADNAKPKSGPGHRVMLRLSKAQYENLAKLAETAELPLAVFCRSVLVRAVKQNRLRGIPSKARVARGKVAA